MLAGEIVLGTDDLISAVVVMVAPAPVVVEYNAGDGLMWVWLISVP